MASLNMFLFIMSIAVSMAMMPEAISTSPLLYEEIRILISTLVYRTSSKYGAAYIFETKCMHKE